MDENIRQSLRAVKYAIEVLMEDEGQDRTMVVELAEQMVDELLAGDTVTPLLRLMARYSTTIDNEVGAELLASEVSYRMETQR